MPAFVLPLDRDRAIITLVDSNLQRENILPSERAFAYRMKSEAMKRQGFRTDLTSSQVVTKLRTDDKVAQGFGVGRMTVQRFIRLTELIPPILQMVDEGKSPSHLRWNCPFEERRAGKSLCHDGERRSNALTLTGTADEKHEPERAA